jgi:Mn-dependent DtxR family transcriptional regulator
MMNEANTRVDRHVLAMIVDQGQISAGAIEKASSAEQLCVVFKSRKMRAVDRALQRLKRKGLIVFQGSRLWEATEAGKAVR